jgi:hypothetical protein
MKRAGPDREMLAGTRERAGAALGHRPARALTVKGDIDRAMILRRASAAPCVIGRKDAADEGDDGQAMLPVVAEGVDVPPDIAAGGDRRIEARSYFIDRSEIIASAAWRPDSAAIGTPGPG